MSSSSTQIMVRGRFLGITVLVSVQFVVGIIHVIFGFILLLGNFSVASYSMMSVAYSFYTVTYGCLTFVFTYLLWIENQLGWIGTVAVSLFVIFADTLAVFDLFNILCIPKLAAIGEIPFSILILMYLLQRHVRLKYDV